MADQTTISRPSDTFILAHGFTQTSRSWELVESLMHDRLSSIDTQAVDLPGHGAAERLTGDLWSSADHLVGRGGRATYIGYSMGGRVALHAALAHPSMVEGLVLIGATAGIDGSGARDQRRSADEQLANRIESIGVPDFLDEWLSNPLFSGLTDETSGRDDRLRNTAHGLASSLRSTGTGVQTPLWKRLGQINVPVLVMVGERDQKFRAIASRLAAHIPRATLETIADAGHSVHLEQPRATVDAIVTWYHEAFDV